MVGLVVMAAMFAGCALGLIVTGLAGGPGVVLAVRSARIRSRVWWSFAVVFAVVLALGIVAVHQYPYGTVRPGSDYDVAAKNLFLQGFGYCASPGAAALLVGLATLLTPKKNANRTPEQR
jgi:hypothetical protein